MQDESSGPQLPPLDRTSPLPLYAQLKNRLMPIIAQWRDTEDRFYTDEELSRMFDVSRDTARQAIAGLVSDGLLTRTRGRGTFVVFPAVEEHFNAGMTFAQQWAERGTPMEMTCLAFERRSADADTAAQLLLPVGTEVLFIKRVRATTGVPIALDFRYLPAHLVPDWGPEAALGSILHRIWRENELTVGDFVITADLADKEAQEHLGLEPSTPVLIRELSYRTASGAVVLAGSTVHRADRARYSMQVPLQKPENAEEPFAWIAAQDPERPAATAEMPRILLPDPD